MSDFSRPTITIENTKFIYERNFAGDPEKDKWGRNTRRANIVIPNEDLAEQLRAYGLDVKCTKPRPGEEEGFVPRYYMGIVVNFDSKVAREKPPIVYLVSSLDGSKVALNRDTIHRLDDVYVLNVDVTIEPVTLPKFGDRVVAYVKVMYVVQEVEEDPFASKYSSALDKPVTYDEVELPFDDEE